MRAVRPMISPPTAKRQPRRSPASSPPYGTAEDPRAYGEKVAHRFFPNMLPYEVGTPAAFGFAEWNGRSLTDNAPDVMFRSRRTRPVRLGIGKESVTAKPKQAFPYMPSAA